MTGNSSYPYIWRWKAKLPERYGQACIVQARGRMNTVRVYFPDGFFVFTSRWAVRLRADAMVGIAVEAANRV